MAVQKERRAAPRKPAPTQKPAEPARPAPPREMPKQAQAARKEPPAEIPSPEDIRRRIEMSAYLKAKQRGFTPGYELEDWLQAEREVKERLHP